MKTSEEKLNKLSQRERVYLDIMSSGNSLYLRGKPGMAKSSIGLSICKKIGIKYVDKRLSQIDETDIGLYPVLNDAFKKLERLGTLKSNGHITDVEFEEMKKPLLENIKNGQIEILHFAIPNWAFDANAKPTLIHLEELNRANQHIRNAALQILNERQIGDLKLNDNVLLMSSGNLGEADGTEVDEMDLALSNRLVILDHDLPLDEWIKEYAQYHVWDVIIDYLRNNAGEYYKLPNDKEIRYASPRSWTNLSKLITYKFGNNPDIKEVIPYLIQNSVGKGFIGNSITGFLTYCQEISNINMTDILMRWNEVKEEVSKFNRSRISQLISNLKYMDLTIFDDSQMNNLLNFLTTIRNSGNDDEITSYVMHLLDHTTDQNYSKHQMIVKHFKIKVEKLKEHTIRNLK